MSTGMIPVNSSAIRAVGHDGHNLAVVFHSNDTVYTFPGVQYHLFLGFFNCDSPGTYYRQNIGGKYK